MLTSSDNPIRFAIPSNSRMHEECKQFLTECGFTIRARKREYLGLLEPFPQIQLVFQRQKDILREVENGSLSFGIIGKDILHEYQEISNEDLLVIHSSLGFGSCQLALAVPQDWMETSLAEICANRQHLRIATKFPRLVRQFLQPYDAKFSIIPKHGSIEVAPALGYSDAIADLVSSGETLQANNLKMVQDGVILRSEAVFIGNRKNVADSRILELARQLLEYFEATLRARDYVQIFANMRQTSPAQILQDLQQLPEAQGLQGPTISPIYTPTGEKWNSMHIVVPKKRIRPIIRALRSIGGSGVVVSPVTYIFEEEPASYQNLLDSLDLGLTPVLNEGAKP